MPGTELRSAVSITVEPICASTVRASPDALTNVSLVIEPNFSQKNRFLASRCVNGADLSRAFLEQARQRWKSVASGPSSPPKQRPCSTTISCPQRIFGGPPPFSASLGYDRSRRLLRPPRIGGQPSRPLG